MAHPLKKHTAESKRLLAQLRKICLALPETTEKIAWGEPTFRVGGKMFAMFDNNHHNAGRIAVNLNAPPGMQEAVVASDPDRFFVPRYVGPKGWIGARLDVDPDWGRIEELVEEAWRATAPKRIAALLG